MTTIQIGAGVSTESTETNPYLAAAGMFADDSFAADVAAYITAQREREREEAGREAGEYMSEGGSDGDCRKVRRLMPGPAPRCL
jgi:hypothetical protein